MRPKTCISHDSSPIKIVRTPLRTFTVSLPIPAFPPVTIMTFPERSGMSDTPHLAFGGGRKCAHIEAMDDATRRNVEL